jgi:hypothetical protein
VWGDSGDAGGDPKADVLEAAQFLNHGVYLLGVLPLRVKDGFSIVEKQDQLPRGQEWSQGSQILRVFDTCTNDLGDAGKKMEVRSWEPITADESPVVAKPVLDVIVVKDSQRDGCFPNAPCTDESDGFEVFGETNDLLNQFATSETDPGRRGRRFSQRNTTQR